MSMEISVRHIHNGIIKPYENGEMDNVVDSVMHKVPINDTILRSFIPPHVRKITPILRQICGCKLCIIPKYMQIVLNIFRTNIVSEL